MKVRFLISSFINMKKIIIYNLYLGVDSEPPSDIIPRLSYVFEQLKFLHRLVRSNFLVDNTRVIVVGTLPEFLDDALKSLCMEYGFFMDFHFAIVSGFELGSGSLEIIDDG